MEMLRWLCKENNPKPQWKCPVHGEFYYSYVVFGSKELCPACIKDLLNKSLPDIESIKE